MVLGGLGLFFFGMKLLSDGLQAIGSGLVRKIINSLTTNRLVAVAVGLLVTTIVQSSSITTVMVVGFVNAGLMNLTQAIGVIFGANIGTTITGWIIAIKIGKYSLLLIGLAIIPMLQGRSERLQQWGSVIFALGLVFLGLQTMGDAFKPLRSNDDFVQLMTIFSADSYFSLLATIAVGCALTFVIQSSSAMLGITIALGMTGAISFQTAAALVMGENIGTTITAILAGLAGNTNARRAALAHAFFNVLGVIVLSLFFWQYIAFIESLVSGVADFTNEAGDKPYIAAHIAASHTIFNVVNVVLFLPFLVPLSKLVTWFYKGSEGKEPKHLEILGGSSTISPSMALSQGSLEIKKMSSMVTEMIDWTFEYFREKKRPVRKRVLKYESITDNIHREMMAFAQHLMQKDLSSEQSRELRQQLKLSDELESIGDYCQKLVQHFQRLKQESLELDDETTKDLVQIMESVSKFAHHVLTAYPNENEISKEYVLAEKEAFHQSVANLKDEFLERVAKSKSPAMANLTIADILHALSRVFSHTKNIAEWQMGAKVVEITD